MKSTSTSTKNKKKRPLPHVRYKQVKSACTLDEYKAYLRLGKQLRRADPRSSLSSVIRDHLLELCGKHGIATSQQRKPAA